MHNSLSRNWRKFHIKWINSHVTAYSKLSKEYFSFYWISYFMEFPSVTWKKEKRRKHIYMCIFRLFSANGSSILNGVCDFFKHISFFSLSCKQASSTHKKLPLCSCESWIVWDMRSHNTILCPMTEKSHVCCNIHIYVFILCFGCKTEK
jgi:hypothetical protein